MISASPAISMSYCKLIQVDVSVGICPNYRVPLKKEPTIFAAGAKILNVASDAQINPPEENPVRSEPYTSSMVYATLAS